MSKIRTFFGIGRKPRNMRAEQKNKELPENFIVGSTNHNTSKDDNSRSEILSSRSK
ncbi:hypothetical protein RQM65_03840 [Pricia sp. S334]|uniref:Uncharacterized protein n=1 Tax=Pricia mediterranea TaxID=3076079 RepID=A0ABU3L229_9FLAO|nr:hypothetical protein [Pricia sp. S334]MDT7827796.1 hypothetical protein [Pricia sp. S334]